jgi:hypothetical protein
MAYRCQRCHSIILVLRLGFCSTCREPIPDEILPESKKQALLQEEREYEEDREHIRKDNARNAEKQPESGGGDMSLYIG